MSILLLDIYGIFGIACWNGGSQSNVNAMWYWNSHVLASRVPKLCGSRVLIGFACVVTLMLYPIYWIFVGVLKKPKVQMKTRIVKFGLASSLQLVLAVYDAWSVSVIPLRDLSRSVVESHASVRGNAEVTVSFLFWCHGRAVSANWRQLLQGSGHPY